jgi:hypothetical protein
VSGRHRWLDRDEYLVQALASRQGVPPVCAEEELAGLLASWVETVDAGLPALVPQGAAGLPESAAGLPESAAGDADPAVLPLAGGLAGAPPGGTAPALADLTASADLTAAVVPLTAWSGRRRAGLGTAMVRAAVAAAVIAVAVTGGLVGAERAQPGSPLWGLSRLVDPDRAASLEARRVVADSLLQVERDIAAGRFDLARQHLARARQMLPRVRDIDGRQQFDGRIAVLQETLNFVTGRDGSPTGGPAGTPAPITPTGTATPTGLPSPSVTPPPGTGTVTPTPSPPESEGNRGKAPPFTGAPGQSTHPTPPTGPPTGRRRAGTAAGGDAG